MKDPDTFFEELEGEELLFPPERESVSVPLLWGISTIAIAGLAIGVFYLVSYLLSAGSAIMETGPATTSASASSRGVTVLPRIDLEAASERPSYQEPLGFALELGAAQSFSELTARYVAISGHNAELGLDTMEPRARIDETESGLEARLLVGPFGSMGEAETACGAIALPAGITCRAAPYEGAPIARE